MFFEFPNDPSCYIEAQNNVMLGAALKLSIRSDNVGKDLTTFYFPPGLWCNVYNATELCKDTGTTGMSYQLRTKAYDFYVHLRGGYIVPMQDATHLNINTTA